MQPGGCIRRKTRNVNRCFTLDIGAAVDFDTDRFDEYREGNRLEVKKARGGLPISMWETYSAFANGYGGLILLGVTENKDKSWNTAGLDIQDRERLLKNLWDTVNDRKKVSVNLLSDQDVEILEISGSLVIAVHVPKAGRAQKPVYINDDMFNGTFRRDGEGDYHCSAGEVRAMLRDQTEQTSDMKILEDFGLDDLCGETIQSYRNRHTAYHPDHVWRNLSDADYLERIGAAALLSSDGRLHPTAAGLLMFGEEYKILREYPEYFLDYREILDPTIRWTDRLQSGSGDWTGNLFDFYFHVNSKLARDLKVPFQLDGIFRVDDTPVHKALREALANCLVNADFFLPRGVVIRKSGNQIIMENPGSIRTGRDQMLRGGISDPRNKALMKMFNLIGIGERAGSGVPDIYAVWDSQGWITPDVNEQYGPDRTILTLTLAEKSADKTGDENQRIKSADKIGGKSAENRQRIVEFLTEYDSGSTAEIADWLGLKTSRTRQLLSEMIRDGQISPVGEGRSRRYRLHEKAEPVQSAETDRAARYRGK